MGMVTMGTFVVQILPSHARGQGKAKQVQAKEHTCLAVFVRNSICIDTRALDPNIYMYMRSKYTKNPSKKYINAKVYYTSNTPQPHGESKTLIMI
jgi:hypothetical protein